jgi:hypothetical protein
MQAGCPVGARAAVVLSRTYLAHGVIMSRRLWRAVEDRLCTLPNLAQVGDDYRARRADWYCVR